jgi:Ca2+/Na+ antiporter
MYSNGIFTLVCLGLNLACLLAYRKHQQQDGPSNHQNGKMERKLAIYTIITFLAQLCMTMFEVSGEEKNKFGKL